MRRQITKLKDKKGHITIDSTGIKKIIKVYSKQFYVNKLDNLDEMNEFLERHK